MPRWPHGVDDVDLAACAVTVRLVALALKATAPQQLGRFWAQALGWNARETDGADVVLVPTDPTSFDVLVRPGAGDKIGQNRIHLDLTTTSLDDHTKTVAKLLSIGARHVDIGQDPTHVVLVDLEGNEFCIIEPGNRFLAGCPRLGAVNCDGTHALGCFWSEALGWRLVWDHEEETAIQAPGGRGPKITWSGTPLMPVWGDERFHIHVAPTPGTNTQDARDHLVALGATTSTDGHGCPRSIELADVDRNTFCLVEPEDDDISG